MPRKVPDRALFVTNIITLQNKTWNSIIGINGTNKTRRNFKEIFAGKETSWFYPNDNHDFADPWSNHLVCLLPRL